MIHHIGSCHTLCFENTQSLPSLSFESAVTPLMQLITKHDRFLNCKLHTYCTHTENDNKKHQSISVYLKLLMSHNMRCSQVLCIKFYTDRKFTCNSHLIEPCFKCACAGQLNRLCNSLWGRIKTCITPLCCGRSWGQPPPCLCS